MNVLNFAPRDVGKQLTLRKDMGNAKEGKVAKRGMWINNVDKQLTLLHMYLSTSSNQKALTSGVTKSNV